MSAPADTTLDRGSFLWCAAAVACALLPLARMVPLWLDAVLLALLLVALACGWHGVKLSAWLRLPMTLAAGAMVLFAYGFRFGRDTGAALLITMLALKLFETRTVRDARSAASFALFAIMAGFLQDQSPLTLALAVLATALVLAALARIAEFETGGIGSVSVGSRLGGIARLAAVSLPLAAVGFFLFPRLASPLWGLPENVAEARTGLGDEMAPGDIANLFIDDTPVLRVQFDGDVPPPNTLYWRGPVLTLFDGRTWTRQGFYSTNLPPAPLEPLGPPIRYEITQEPTDRRYLIMLDVPAEAPDGARIGLDRTVSTRRVQTQLAQYRGESYARYRFEPQLYQTLRQGYLQLPPDYNPRTRALVAGWVQEGVPPEQLVQRALQWFNREFTYTLSPMLLGRDSIDDFLFSTRQGYCEHFASAFVVMMRMAGVPARVITGYQGGRSNDIGGYWVVRQSDAHAWAEVWLEGRGWMRVDPTSAVAPERIERGTESLAGTPGLWRGLRQPLADVGDWLRRGWNDLVLGFNAQRQRLLLRPLGLPDARPSQLVLVLAAGLALALALTLWLVLRGSGVKRDPLQQAWHVFTARLARAGIERAAHEGPASFGERAAAQLPELAPQLLALSRRYALRRYAPIESDARTDAQLCDDLRRFRVPS